MTNSAPGTLGCYIELKLSTESQWKRLALTNYHIVRPLLEGFQLEGPVDGRQGARPGVGTLLRTCDDDGIRQGHGLGLQFEHPSRRRHNHMVELLKLDLSELATHLQDSTQPSGPGIKDDYMTVQKRLDEKKDFFDDDKHILGPVFAASGFRRRSASGHRMDWALVDVVPNRQGINGLPTRKMDEWRKNGVLPKHRPANAQWDSPQLHQPGSSLKSMKDGTRVWKLGAKSGPTFGTYSGFKAAHGGLKGLSIYTDSSGTLEHSFVPIDTSGSGGSVLTVPGDSGSIAYDSVGCAVGMILSGIPPKRTRGAFTLVTPIEDAFEDIKKFTGAVAIRVAQ